MVRDLESPITNRERKKEAMVSEIYKSGKGRVRRFGRYLVVEVVVGQDAAGNPKYGDAPVIKQVRLLKEALIDADTGRRAGVNYLPVAYSLYYASPSSGLCVFGPLLCTHVVRRFRLSNQAVVKVGSVALFVLHEGGRAVKPRKHLKFHSLSSL